MPFIIDNTWTPTRYRRALAVWHASTSPRDSDIMLRPAEPIGKPKHDKLSRKLRSLLTWRAMNRGDDWTAIAANDNVDPDDEPVALLLDRILEQRPTIGEIRVALKDVEFQTRRHTKLGGGGGDNVVPVGGDMERGKVYGQGRNPKPDCIVRLGKLHFSNGAVEEPCIKLEGDKPVRGAIRIELGGLVRFGSKAHRPIDRFGKPRGAANSNIPPTVGKSENANAGAMDFVDPVADAQHAGWVRAAVGESVAEILDLALVAANFREIGEHLGHAGKVAERKGKAAVIDACAVLDVALAA